MEETTIVHQDDLPALVRKVRLEAGLTQQEVADRLDVANPSISRAETRPGSSYLKLRLRILEEIGGLKLRGPLWEIERPLE